MTTTDAFLGAVIRQPVLTTVLTASTERQY